VTAAYITARIPADVAREVETMYQAGYRKFVLRAFDGGGMLDLERLGAARYAAGLQAEVEVEGQSSPGGSSEGAGVVTPEVARAR
jgi:L-alanine-DL-glutamate epimerase-like enolase superfamily enzyme